MELDLLMRRAEKIPGGKAGTGTGLDRGFRLLPGESFSCSGTMTGLLLAGAVMKRKMGKRDKYPEIQIWRNTSGNTYTRNSSQEIRLARGDFSPDGVLQYNLTTPISYQSGDVLGVYQPDQSDSVVRVYYDTNASTTYKYEIEEPKGMGTTPAPPPTSVYLSELTLFNKSLILISPISTG